ncbi:MAG: hypothetical protein CSA81_00755 [Acidobacteria bacterium]|nr:MAG: hypothetical protein CSA81_00755 [Acidobacteriota bacterium]
MGKWSKSARQALRAKEFLQAGDFYKMDGSYRAAIRAYLKGKHFINAAVVYEQIGKPKKAEKILRKQLLWQDLASFLVRQHREHEAIEVYQLNGRKFEAAELYEKMNRPEPAAYLYMELGFHEKAGRLFTKSRNFEQAIIAIETAMSMLDTKMERTHTNKALKMKEWLANLHLGARKYVQAAELFSELLKHDLAAKSYLKAEKPLEAASELIKAGRLDNAKTVLEGQSSVDARVLLGKIYAEEGDMEKAVEFLKDTSEHTLLSEAFEQMGLYREAAEHLEKSGELIRAANFFAKAHEFKKAALIYEERTYHQEAAVCYEKADNYLHAAKLYKLVKDNYKTGECLFKSGKLQDALPFLQLVDEHDSNYPMAKRYMAEIFYTIRDFNISSKLFEELIRKHGFTLSETNMDIYYRLARSLESQGKREEALQYFERIYTRKSDYLDTKQRMRALSERLGRIKLVSHSSAPLTAKELKPGQIIADRFRIDKEIGKGGMGYIFSVWDISLSRTVALKMLIHSKGDLEELKAELITARELTHPYIIKVFDIGQWRDVSYFTMELVEGKTLKEFIESETRSSLEQNLLLFTRICEGIKAAHDQGVIHRDLKPQNIIITADGTPKILDFGIARRYTGQSKKQGVSGSPKYMAPEQILNEDMDPRTDIYALGIIMYYLFTGKEPFTGNNANEILLKQINQQLPDPMLLNREIPFWLVEIIQHCSNKNKDLRYSDVQELLSELKLNMVDLNS